MGPQGDLVALQLAKGRDFFVGRQGVGENDRVTAECDEMTGGKVRGLIAVLLKRWQAVF